MIIDIAFLTVAGGIVAFLFVILIYIIVSTIMDEVRS